MNVAPDLSGYPNVQVTASANLNGTSPVAEYNPTDIEKYKSLIFAASTDTPVSDFNLALTMSAPVAGQTPAKVIADGSQYTGTVQWTENPAIFLGNTVYTATLTLTASNGYTFAGIHENALFHAGATSVTHARGYGRTLTVTIVFRETAVLQSISVTTPPIKTTYKYGEAFSPEGMVVKATFSDGSEDANFTAYTVDKQGPLSMSDDTITLTASGTSITTTLSITVNKADGPSAPGGLSGVAPTTPGGTDGKITGTTAAMEYADNTDFSGAINCSAIETTGLAEGTYYVRVRETDTHKAGAHATVNVPAFSAPVDKSALHSSITAAGTAKAGILVSTDGEDVDTTSEWVTEAVMDVLNAAITSAETVMNDPSATQEQVDDAAQALGTAVSTFNAAKQNGTKAGEPSINKAALLQAITNAGATKTGVAISTNGSDVDTVSKWVTEAVMDALNAAITSAETVMNDPSATQAQVDDAAQALQTAISTFNAAKQNGTKAEGGTTKPSIEVSETNVGALKEVKDRITATTEPGAFSQPVELKITDDVAAENAFHTLLGSNNGTILAFDISLYIKGTDTKTQPNAGHVVTIRIPLPQHLWDVRDTIKVGHVNNGKVEVLTSSLVWENGMWNIEFYADSFSPYALLVGVKDTKPTTPTTDDPYIAATGVMLNISKLSLTWGNSETLIATVMPANATNRNLTWKSSNPSVVTVDENGKVTAVSAGKATISVTTRDGGHVASCAVTAMGIGIPKTGDSNNMTGMLIAMLAAIVGLVGITLWRKYWQTGETR